MANLRDLKKDIDYLCGQVVIDCLIYAQTSEKPDLDQAQEIVNEALLLDTELRRQANHPDGKDNPKLVKAYYVALTKELVSKCDAMYNHLNNLV
ncbi:MAG: hypothetical protein ACK5MI_04355 [Mangrovibacterium sp.]